MKLHIEIRVSMKRSKNKTPATPIYPDTVKTLPSKLIAIANEKGPILGDESISKLLSSSEK